MSCPAPKTAEEDVGERPNEGGARGRAGGTIAKRRISRADAKFRVLAERVRVPLSPNPEEGLRERGHRFCRRAIL